MKFHESSTIRIFFGPRKDGTVIYHYVGIGFCCSKIRKNPGVQVGKLPFPKMIRDMMTMMTFVFWKLGADLHDDEGAADRLDAQRIPEVFTRPSPRFLREHDPLMQVVIQHEKS